MAKPEQRADGTNGSAPSRYLARSFHAQWGRYDRALKRCRRKFSAESVHQLRVETRRLSALLVLLHQLLRDARLEAIERVLKDLFKDLSRLRDTQVQLLYVREAKRQFPETDRFQRALARREQRLIRRARKSVKDVALGRLRKRIRPVDLRLEERSRDRVRHRRDRQTLSRCLRQAFHRAVLLKDRVEPSRPATIHRARIAFKKFRYLVELLQPFLPEVTPRIFESLHSYQTMMGEIQDLEVLAAAVDDFVDGKARRASRLQRFRRHVQEERAGLVDRYLRHASRLDRFRYDSLSSAPRPRG